VPADELRGTRRLDFAGLAIAVPAVFLVVLPLLLGHELGWHVRPGPPWYRRDTTMQLGQVIGVASFGTVYLSLATPFPPHSLARLHSSAHAMSTTAELMAVLSVVGVMG
jgi:hypothetical protein